MQFVYWIICSSFWWSVTSIRGSTRRPTRPLSFIAHHDHEFVGEDPVLTAELKRRMSNLNKELPTRRTTPIADTEKFSTTFKDNTDGEFGLDRRRKGRRFIQTIYKTYKNTIAGAKAGIKAAKEGVQDAVQQVKKGYEYGIDKIKEGYEYGVEKVQEGYEYAVQKVKEGYEYSVEQAKIAAKAVEDKLVEVGNQMKEMAIEAEIAARDYAKKALQAAKNSAQQLKRQYQVMKKRAQKFARKVAKKARAAYAAAKKVADDILEWFRTIIPRYHPYWDLLDRKKEFGEYVPKDNWAPGKGDEAKREFEFDWDEDEIYGMQLKTAEQCIYGLQKRIEEVEPIIMLHADDPLVRMAHVTKRLDKWLLEMNDFFNYTHSPLVHYRPWIVFEWMKPYNGENPYWFANLRHIMYYEAILKRYIDIQYGVELQRKLQASSPETYEKNAERLRGLIPEKLDKPPPGTPLEPGFGP